MSRFKNKEYNTVEEIIKALEAGEFLDCSYVAKKYSIANLVRDLKKTLVKGELE